MSKLIAIEGPFKGQTFPLREAMVLGRSIEADLRLDDLAISRRHARISLVGGSYFIEDLGSGNGTAVNGKTIAAPIPLKNGDRIELADNVFRFASESEPSRQSGVTIVDEPSAAAPPALETLEVKAVSMEAAMAQRITAPDALIKARQRLRAVLEISNAVQTQLDMDKLLNEIMDRLFGVFPQADRGFIMLKADESDELVPRAARQRGREQPEAITLSRSIVQKAMGDRVALLSADAMGDQRFAMALSVMNFRIRSMMCAPIVVNDEALGIIHLDTTRQDRQFTRDDLELLAGITSQTAFAIANARLHHRLLLQERTERDLQFARQVQESFLPRRLPEVAGMQFCCSYKAALEVGGDFYDFIPLEGGSLAIVVGDVAGKGIPAALMMARMSSTVREFALASDEPRRVVALVNDRLAAMEAESSFITLVFALLDPRSRTLQMVNAGHPPPLLRKGSTGRVSEIQTCTNFPVGVMPGAEFEAESFRIEPGDFVCFYSDGITEAMNAQQDSYGSGRLKSVAALPAASAAQWMENILRDVHAFVGSAHQSDDLTLVCFGAT
ncbi:MAG: SpoIIE family protein phosphatase [Candidatus Brocadiia bacterium]